MGMGLVPEHSLDTAVESLPQPTVGNSIRLLLPREESPGSALPPLQPVLAGERDADLWVWLMGGWRKGHSCC
jgi:hypothetical protein